MRNKYKNGKMAIWGILFLLGFSLFINRRALWTCWEIKRNNLCTIDSQCISVDLGKTQEVNGVAFDERIYCFTLEDGQIVSAYKDVVDEALSIHGVDDLNYVKNTPMRYTYIPEYIFTNDTYVLLSISNSQGYILAPEGMLSWYHNIVMRIIYALAIWTSPFLIFRIISAIIYWHLGMNWDGTKRKKRKKKPKSNKN